MHTVSRRIATFASVVVIFSSRDAEAASCLSSGDLEALVTCIRNQMPGSGSGIFVEPNDTEKAEWRNAVNEMMDGNCAPPLGSLGSAVEVGFVADSGIAYCVLHEVRDANGDGRVDRGLGTFIVNHAATRELGHQAPHPVADSTTEIQAVRLFEATRSRSFLMAGSHRNASNDESTCQDGFDAADVPHNVDNMFQVTNDALARWYTAKGDSSWHMLQWHGMAASTCDNVEVYMTHGMAVAPTGEARDKILQLQNAILAFHPTWRVDVPGRNTCSLNATTNTQGRLLNLVDERLVCSTAASNYTGRFLHVEQDPGFRNAADWTDAILAAFPATPVAPPAPTNLAASARRRRVDLRWGASAGAMTYTVKRAQNQGGPYGTVASKITARTYTDSNLQRGVTYHYVVTAVIPGAGESAASPEVSATPK